MNLLWNYEERRLRALWRIVLQLLLMLFLGLLPILLVAEPLTALHRRGLFLPGYPHDAYDRIVNMIVGPLLTAGVIASVVLAAKWLDRRPLATLGVVLDALWWRGLAIGFLLGAALMSLLFVVEYEAGWLAVTGTSVMLAFSVEKVICVGIYEEFVSRGYLLRNLAEGIGLPGAIVVSSAIFGVLHVTNPNSSPLSICGLVVNGVLFAAAVLVTRRLSTAIGLHVSWNLFEGAVFGFPVSGDKEGASLIGIRQLGNSVVTGGAFGPEAGMVGVAASLLGIAVLLLFGRRRR